MSSTTEPPFSVITLQNFLKKNYEENKLKRPIHLEEAWELISMAIKNLTNIVDGKPDPKLTSEENMILSTIVCNICCQKPPHDYSGQLHDKCRQSLEYMTSMIAKLREGKHDSALLRNILEMFVEMQLDKMILCNDFDGFLLKSITVDYVKAHSWIFEGSHPYYMTKAMEYANQEEQVPQHVHINNEQNLLLREVRTVLFAQYPKPVLEKEQPNFFALLCDGKVEGLSRMYELFERIDRLPELSNMFRKYLMDEIITNLVRHAEDSDNNNKMRKMVELHNKCAAHVMKPFKGDTLFRKVFRDSVSHSSSNEFFAAICEHILKKGCTGNLNDKAIKHAFHEAVRSLADISDKDLLAETYRKVFAKAFLSFHVKRELVLLLRKKHIHPKNYLSDLLMWLEEWCSDRSHKVEVMVETLLRFLGPLDQYISDFMYKGVRTPLEQIWRVCFQELIYQEIKGHVKDDVLALISEERESQKKINITLVKKVLDMFHNMEPTYYEHDFIVPLLKRTNDYYSEKAPRLYHEYPNPDDYMKKVDECLTREMELADQYSPFNIKPMLLQEVQNVLLASYSEALFLDDKVEDLYRMYILALDCGCLLGLILEKFEVNLKNEINESINQAKEPASNLEGFMCKISKLQDKYEARVAECFQGHASFRQAHQKSFEFIFTDSAGAELVADFCENILKKGCSERLSDEAIKGALDKVARLLTWVSDKDLIVKFFRNKLPRRLQEWFQFLVDTKDKDLSRVYRLFFEIVGGQEPFIGMFKKHLTNESEELRKQAIDFASKEVFVWKIIELHDKYDLCATEFFQAHAPFREALQKAVESIFIVGLPGSSSSEFLATFCDSILKKGCCERPSGDEAIEDVLDKVVRLLSKISEKNLFVQFYRDKLGRRLLLDEVANHEHEKIMLTKLKQRFGSQFTARMEGMFNDHTVASDQLTEFRMFTAEHPELNPIDLNVTVSFENSALTVFTEESCHKLSEDLDLKGGSDLANAALRAGFCRSYEIKNLPPEMVACLENFEMSYKNKCKDVPKEYETIMTGKKPNWLYFFGTCNINANFVAKPIELIVTTYQAALLLLFNGSDRLSSSEIVTQLKLSPNHVACLLHSLSCGEYNILNKEPANTSISTSDVFEFNPKFTDSRATIKIPLPPVDLKMKDVRDVDNDWRYTIDACIVRIMKNRKVMGHNELVEECLKKLSQCEPDHEAIKKRIEDLIKRDYLERDKNNSDGYRYVE